jgi:MFS family permease
LVSALGDAVVPVALALAVLQLSHSPLMLGVVLATSLLARVVSLLIGGVYADQTSRWLIMAVADGVRLLVQGLAGVLLVTHHANVGTLLVLGILYGAAAGMFAPASSGLLPELVTRDHLQQANAVLGLGRNVARILGPLTAALIVAVASPGWAFLIDATSFAVDGVILLAIGRRLGVARRQPTPLGPALRDGLVELRGRPWYLANLGVHSLWNVAMAGFYVLGPAVVLATSGAGEWGLVSATFAVGGIAGGLVALSVTPRRALVIVNLLIAAAGLPLLALAFQQAAVVVAVAAGLAAAGSTFANEVWTAVAQRALPREVLSRLMSFDWLVSQALSPIGYLLVGVGAESWGSQPTLVVAALLAGVPGLGLAVVSATGRLEPEGATVTAEATT